MEKGKIIVIEGTDCSGKETQSKKLIERLNNEGVKTEYYSFPAYNTPTGRIVGLAYLGKPYLAEEMVDNEINNVFQKLRTKDCTSREVLNILKVAYSKSIDIIERVLIKSTLYLVLKRLNKKETNLRDKVLIALVLDEVKKSLSHGWFPEGAPAVDPKVSCLLYAADRRYNMPVINETLESGTNIILDRYTYSNMAHQGGKISNPEKREAMFKWIAALEFDFLELPQSDARLFLHMPTEYASILRATRKEKLDENERDVKHLLNSEKAFIEVADMFDFETIECVNKRRSEAVFEDIKTPDEISKEVYAAVKRRLTLR